MSTYSYDRTAATDDTEDLFGGSYVRRASPQDALDGLVPAFRKWVDTFIERMEAEARQGKDSAGRPMMVNNRKLHGLIMNHLLSNYGMERSLAKGFADQITKGQNY